MSMRRQTGNQGEPSDEDLARRCVHEGDEQAFAELVFRYQNAILRLTTRFTANPEDAEDLALDTFVRAWERRRQYDPGRPFRPWLYQVGTHLCLNWLEARRARGGGGSVSLDALGDFVGSGSPERLVGQRLEEETVLATLGEMPDAMRVAITLRFLEGLAFQEIAAILRLPLPTVAARVRRGLAELRHRLEALGIDGP
jgi:RNA polymerase sigma-70 factor (ECF subfamily)